MQIMFMDVILKAIYKNGFLTHFEGRAVMVTSEGEIGFPFVCDKNFKNLESEFLEKIVAPNKADLAKIYKIAKELAKSAQELVDYPYENVAPEVSKIERYGLGDWSIQTEIFFNDETYKSVTENYCPLAMHCYYSDGGGYEAHLSSRYKNIK